MGRKRKRLNLHKVKGYYSTYLVGKKKRYHYFGTHDPEVAYQAYQKWNAELSRATDAGMDFDEWKARQGMALRKGWARFIISLPEDFDGRKADFIREYKRWMRDQKAKASG